MVQFGDFTIDPRRRRLSKCGSPLEITPKCFDLLNALVECAGSTVSRRDLMTTAWNDAGATEATLTQHMFMLRRLLGDTGRFHEYIATIPGVGYRFVGQIARLERSV